MTNYKQITKNYEEMIDKRKHYMSIIELKNLSDELYHIALIADKNKMNDVAEYFYTMTERVNTYIKTERKNKFDSMFE